MQSSSLPYTSGRLLRLLVVAFYALFTLLPDSHSLMVAWPWVAIWQVGLAVPVIWWAWQLWQQRHWYCLGNGLDWIAGLAAIGIVLSSLTAEFPNQARWYGWAALCGLATLYALNQYFCHSQDTQLTSPETPPSANPSNQSFKIHAWPLLMVQASLNLAFILTSLWLWVTQTWWPELSKLQQLQTSGIRLSVDLSILQLRNWAPIGHQNYVAGYLLLAIPLLAGLALTQVGWQRWVWGTATGLGLVDLYTTNSRGGWLGLLVAATVVGGLWLWQRRRWLIWFGLVPIVTGLVFVNERLRAAIVTLLSGQSNGEIAFRAINTVVGWRIGLDHPWLGAGLGSVPLLYQRYRPIWAGREAELTYQLHSTPVQLWAELGLWGVITAASMLLVLAYVSLRALRQPHPLTIGLLSGLLAYSIMALTDYQLDNISISGTIVLYVALLACQCREQAPRLAGTTVKLAPLPNHGHVAPKLALAIVALLIAVSLWLWPIHYAWNLSNQGFAALSRQDFTTFTQRLEQAQRWAPWEPYYPNQLGWVSGNMGLETRDPEAIQSGIKALQRSLTVAPDQEFASTNLGWLLMTQDPQAATAAFLRSAQLAPAKRGIFYSLGMSLIAQGKTASAVTAFTLELLRDPQLIANPIWQSGDLQPLAAPVIAQAQAQLHQWLKLPSRSSAFTAHLHQIAGLLAWWQGDWINARTELSQPGVLPTGHLLMDVTDGKSVQLGDRPTAGELAIAAWAQPTQRPALLTQAWITATRTQPPSNLLQAMVETMNQSQSFHQWLTQYAPARQYRRERSGFGILSRHIDGPIPRDFLVIGEIIPVTVFFSDLFHNPTYLYDLDRALANQWQPYLTQLATHNRSSSR